MSKQVVEYDGMPVGITVPPDGRVGFIAVKFHVYDLNDQTFDAPADIIRAISRLGVSRAALQWAA